MKTDTKVKSLAANEAIIAGGLNSFHMVGAALLEIKVNQLYTKSYGQGIGWSSYLSKRWNMTTQHAGRLIGASKVVQQLIAEGVKANDLPKTEGAARKVAKKAKKGKTLVKANKEVKAEKLEAKVIPINKTTATEENLLRKFEANAMVKWLASAEELLKHDATLVGLIAARSHSYITKWTNAKIEADRKATKKVA